MGPSNLTTKKRNPTILSESLEIGHTSNILEPIAFNNSVVDFRKVNCFELNFQAFETKSTSHNQSVLRSSQNAVRIQAHRATLKIVSAILDCGKSDGQRALALHRALIHPRIREIAKSAGFQNEKMKELSYHSEQIKEFISLASHTRNKQGKPKKEESEVINTIVAALSADVTARIDGNIMKEQKAPSGRSTSRLYGFSPYHAKKGMLNRQNIVIAKASGPNSRWWNNWVIVDCSKPTNARKEDPDHEILIKESHRVILEKEAARTSEKIIIGNIGAISTDDPAADGYYLVEWSGHPYQTELVATSLQDTNPPTIVPKGEWLCVAQYLNKVPRAKGWYTQSTVCVTVRLQQVIASNLHLQPLSSTNKLPNTCNKTVAQRKAAKKLSGHLHDVLLSEIARRDMMDHFEDTDDVEVASDEEEEFDVTENEDSDNSDNSE